MILNYIPTELEIATSAAVIFPDNIELRNSYIQGVYRTIYYSKSK